MSMMDRLMKRLHRVFNKDPQGVPAISIDATSIAASITIRNNTLIIATDLDRGVIALAGKTVAGLVDEINSWAETVYAQLVTTDSFGDEQPYLTNDMEEVLVLPAQGGAAAISASIADASLGGHLACGLLDIPTQPLVPGLLLHYPTSLFYTEMQVYALALQEQADRLADLEKQLYLHSADGEWLDFWGRDMFGITRFTGETDDEYQLRVLNEITAPTQNNVALSLIIKRALGVDARILDAVPYINELPPEQQGNAVGRFLLDLSIDNTLSVEEAEQLIERTKALVRKFKAAGTDFIQSALRRKETRSETISVAETLRLNIRTAITEEIGRGPIFVGAGWRVGTPGLLVGENDAIKEQCTVTVRNVEDNSIVSQYYYGG